MVYRFFITVKALDIVKSMRLVSYKPFSSMKRCRISKKIPLATHYVKQNFLKSPTQTCHVTKRESTAHTNTRFKTINAMHQNSINCV